ncbi:MAG: aminotransferase class I/II-fold pyridoxal phosphate-dependent enzyme [Candidatus Eisenbacteria bacterium]|nr:aminotransferase class I/II-fold pyridoxal phosphate-dependent enzyme [Candidatus Eisenbacteria bacterium]
MARLAARRRVDDLALFGGWPAFREPLCVGRPAAGDRARLLERIRGVLDRRWFTNDGPLVREFEHQLARTLGVRHAVATCNGTVAIEILARAAELTGEVVVPAFTFVATAHALRWVGLKPVFCDVEPHGHTLDPARVEACITPRTRAILGVHLWGRTCHVEALEGIARRRGLRLFFDAAHAFGCTRGGRPVGGFGDAEVFSFHATKVFNTFEGGAVTTDNDGLAHRLRLMRNFGFAGYDQVVSLGINGKMSEISAAMGLTGLESLESRLEENRRHHERYRAGLAGLSGVKLLRYDEAERNNFQYVVVEIDPEQAGVGRDRLVEILHAENVIARRYFHPGVHRMEPYRSEDPAAGRRLPVTESLAQRVLTLPTGPATRPRDVERVCELVRFVVAHAHELDRKAA